MLLFGSGPRVNFKRLGPNTRNCKPRNSGGRSPSPDVPESELFEFVVAVGAVLVVAFSVAVAVAVAL